MLNHQAFLPRFTHLSYVMGVLISSALYLGAAETTVPVWPGQAPGEVGPSIGAEESKSDGGVLRASNVTVPTLTIYPPTAGVVANGTAIVLCPGGGYNILAMDLEGTEVATWLGKQGITTIMLKYRVPRRSGRPYYEAPVQDGQRAMSMVRAHAKEWNIQPERIGIMGFSAGGHLAATVSTHGDQRLYSAADEIDRVSCRPDFSVLIYPAYLQEALKLNPEITVSDTTPPAFISYAADDGIGPENGIAYFLALKQRKIPVELHLYPDGGHGYGLRPSTHACTTWPDRLHDWLAGRGLLKPAH